MQTALVILGSFIAVIGIIPYLKNVVKKKTKPRIVSWFTWSLLTAIASAASFAEEDYPSAILTLVSSLVTLTVVILGLKYGDRNYDKFDIVAQAFALFGLALWLMFNTPLIALIFSVAIDFVAGLPTVRHSWKKPDEETAVAFFFGAIGSLLVVISVGELDFSGLLFPLYLTVMNTLIFSTIVYRRKHLKTLSHEKASNK